MNETQSTKHASPDRAGRALTRTGRLLVLASGFLGWLFAGTIMVIIPLVGRPATISFLGPGREGLVGNWFAWYICAFLLGAAAGGLIFGWLGDRVGRARAMGLSILCYSALTGVTYLAQSPQQLLVLRFLACLGVGGMWPNGISLVSEAWSNVSRPFLAGLIGASANIGFVLLGMVASRWAITPDNWRWVMLICASPALLGLFVLAFVPESPLWLAGRDENPASSRASPISEVFGPGLLKYTLLGICLGAIPLLGNWGGANWLVPWADQAGDTVDPPDTTLKGRTQTVRSAGATLGALLGGWLASRFGRRTTYFAISLCSLVSSIYVFWFYQPLDSGFLFWTFVLGFFGTVYFGWLPLYLPELFPTRVRATGSGVTFNFGRIATAVGVLAAGVLIEQFQGDYAKVGQATCLIYVLGMIVICFAPDTSTRRLENEKQNIEDL